MAEPLRVLLLGAGRRLWRPGDGHPRAPRVWGPLDPARSLGPGPPSLRNSGTCSRSHFIAFRAEGHHHGTFFPPFKRHFETCAASETWLSGQKALPSLSGMRRRRPRPPLSRAPLRPAPRSDQIYCPHQAGAVRFSVPLLAAPPPPFSRGFTLSLVKDKCLFGGLRRGRLHKPAGLGPPPSDRPIHPGGPGRAVAQTQRAVAVTEVPVGPRQLRVWV